MNKVGDRFFHVSWVSHLMPFSALLWLFQNVENENEVQVLCLASPLCSFKHYGPNSLN